MPRALEIQIDVTRLDRAVDSVRSLSREIRGVGTAQRTITGVGGGDGDGRHRIIGVGGGDGDGRRGGGGGGFYQPRGLVGPTRAEARPALQAGQLAAAEAARENRRQFQIADAARQQAEREFASFSKTIQNPYDRLAAGTGRSVTGGRATSFMDRATTALRSTRFAAGGVSPLIGRTADVLGVPTTGGAGLGLAGLVVAAGALTLFAKTVAQATEHINDFGQAMRLSGGTAGDVAQLGRVGLTGPGAAGRAAAFAQRISVGGDPFAQMYAAQYGLGARLGRPFGPTNEAGTLRQGIEVLRGITDQEQRLRVARQFELDDLLKYVEASPKVQEMLQRQAELAENLGKSADQANDLSIATESLSRSWENLKAIVVAPAMTEFADKIENLAERLDKLQRGDILGGFGPLPEHADAIRDNTQAHRDTQDALNNHANAMQNVPVPPGTYGGGAGVQGSAPAGWSGDFLGRQHESGALGRGAALR